MCRSRTYSDYLSARHVTIVTTHWTSWGSTTNEVAVYNGPEQVVPSPWGSAAIAHGVRLLHLWLDWHLDAQGAATVHERLVRHARTCPQGAPCSHLAQDLDVLYRDRAGIVGGEPRVPQLTPEPKA